MRKLILMMALIVLFIIPTRVNAQGDVHLSSLGVDIWPEYDQPAVLVIYRIALTANTNLPAVLSIRIPSDAQINAVAVVDPNKGLLNTPYDSTVQGQWAVLKVTTNTLQMQVECYMPLVKDGTTRHISFKWAGDYALDKLDVNFLKPFSAQNVILSLAPTDTGPGQDGLMNYHIQKTNLAVGQTFNLNIDYQRQTDDLSITSRPVQAASTPGPNTPGHVSMTGLPLILAGIGVLLIVAGIFGFTLWQRSGQAQVKVKRKPSARNEESGEVSIYCAHCGKRARPGDVFCRTCGTRIKRDSAA
jgi:hypothetical protein